MPGARAGPGPVTHRSGQSPARPPAAAAGGGLADGPQPPGELGLLLAQAIARHFAGASTDGAVVRPGFGDLEIECRVHGPAHNQGQWLVHNHLDRAMTGPGADPEPLAAEVRGRLGGRPHLTPQVLAAVPRGLLTQREASLLSVFVMEGMGRRTVEVKVNGVDTQVDWPTAAPPPSGARGLALLRELALLVPPGEPAQPALAPGRVTGCCPRRIGDEIPLAQAGCNAVWVLKVGGDYGSVWVNSTPLDGRRRRVADSFTAWYRAWLDHAAANRGAWTHWSQAACVTTGMLRQLTEEHRGSRPRTAAGLPDLSGVLNQLAISGWNDYLPPPSGDMLIDPCQHCAELLALHNVPEDVIKRGALCRAATR